MKMRINGKRLRRNTKFGSHRCEIQVDSGFEVAYGRFSNVSVGMLVLVRYITALVVGESTYTYITVSLIPMFFISATLFDGTIVLTEWKNLRTAPSARRTLLTIEQSSLSPSEEYNGMNQRTMRSTMSLSLEKENKAARL